MLSIPPTANITIRQKCGVSALDFSNYTERSSSAPIAQIAIDFDALEQTQWKILRSQLDAAKGVLPVQIPHIGGNRQFLVLEYSNTPLLCTVSYRVALRAIEQRSGLIELLTTKAVVAHSPQVNSRRTKTYKTSRQQYQGGFQSSIPQGNVRTSITNWDVVFHLNRLEADTLDTTLIGLRGIFPFYWQPAIDDYTDSTNRWLCDEWQTEYYATDFCIFTAKFTNYDSYSPNYRTVWITGDEELFLITTTNQKILTINDQSILISQ